MKIAVNQFLSLKIAKQSTARPKEREIEKSYGNENKLAQNKSATVLNILLCLSDHLSLGLFQEVAQ